MSNFLSGGATPLVGVHPYELPEWVVLDVDPLTSRPYRDWVRA